MKNFLCLVCLIFCSTTAALALPPTAQEMNIKDKWVAAKFGETAPNTDQEMTPGIYVKKNHDPLQLNSRSGKPMKIGEQTFDKGLYAHAVSDLLVQLPGKGDRFRAVIGVDNNVDTSGGRGSIQFIVQVDGQNVYQSDVMHGGDPGVSIDIELKGAQCFSLLVSDAGDGIACDQADWAAASVTLQDGSEIMLGDMELTALNEDMTFDKSYPFSFVYKGESSTVFLNNWKKEVQTEQIDPDKRNWTLTFTDPDGQLQVECRAVDYIDFPTVEWTLYFRNISDKETPVIENIQAIDTVFSRKPFPVRPFSWWDPEFGTNGLYNREHEFLLHHFVGAPVRIDDYLPLESSLPPGAEKKIVADAGRPVTLFSPYFNIQAYDEGWIVVLGWPGTWFADFKRVDNLSLQVQGGQSRTHFKLLPGEEVRSPLVVVQAWKRDTWFDAQNVWRAWMIKHSIPRLPDGTFVDHHIAACSSHFFAEMTQANTESQITFIDRYLEENIPLDYWWMDAGWYPCDGQWPKTGTWEVDETRFPGGFRPISDHGHQKGVKTLVWFEPERVHSGTWLTENHPDWILGGADGGLLNYGNPEALDWTINHFDDLIKKNGIDLYRQDFNMEPGEYWRNGDTEDRQGITENHHVCGYLTYWDSLLKRNPGLRIDSCAGGGKRNELETMRRAVPLLRSDYILEAVGNQNQMLGISLWIPYHGTGIRALDDYGFRSIMSPYLNLAYDIREKESDYDNVRKNLNIWKTIFVPLYGKDYYPLSGLSDRDDATVSAFDINSIWAGWQFNDPENGNGAIQMFRRIKSQYSEGTFKLYGLDAGARYEFTDVDTGATQIVSGQELLETGLKIRIDKPETAIILSYRKL